MFLNGVVISGIFRRRLKNGMYEGSMLHKEIYYINVHANYL